MHEVQRVLLIIMWDSSQEHVKGIGLLLLLPLNDLRQWRWVAFQVCPHAGLHGVFPWEQAGEEEAARG